MNARLSALLCAVSVLGSLAGGCAGGGEATPPPPAPPRKAAVATSQPTVRRSTVTQAPLSKSAAIAFARAVNLTAADLADAHASSRDRNERPEREINRCGFVQEHELASASSPSLKRGSQLETEQIGSSVTVYTSEAAAHRELAALKSSSGQACAIGLLRKRFVGKTLSNGGRVTRVDLTPLPAAGPPAGSGVGIRLAMWVAPAHQEASIPAYGDFFAFTRGPAVISYGVISLVQPEPATVDQQIGARLSSRAGAYSL